MKLVVIVVALVVVIGTSTALPSNSSNPSISIPVVSPTELNTNVTSTPRVENGTIARKGRSKEFLEALFGLKKEEKFGGGMQYPMPGMGVPYGYYGGMGNINMYNGYEG